MRLAVVALALPPLALAQDPPRIGVATEVVEVEAVVTDSRGNPAADLARDDFEVLEDGRPQPITHFSRRATARAARPAAAGPPPESASRRLLIAVDDLHLAPASLSRARAAVRAFLEAQAPPDEPVGLLATSGSFAASEPFTADRALILRALDRIAPWDRSTTDDREPPRLTRYQADLIDRGDRGALDAAMGEIRRDDPGSLENVARMRAEAKARAIVAETRRFTRLTLTTLRAVVQSLAGLSGRKVLVLVSDGFYMGELGQDDLRAITAAATRAGVVVYAIDARGIPTPMADAADNRFDPVGEHERYRRIGIEADRDALNVLARDTGGLPLFNVGDIGVALRRVLDDTDAYYVLGFEPGGRRDGRFRKLEVRVKRAGLRVRSRSGYLAPDDRPAKARKDAGDPRQARLAEALSSLFPVRDIPVAAAGAFLDAGNGPEMVVSVEVALDALRFEGEGADRRARIDFGGVVVDETGAVAGRFGERAEIRAPAAGAGRSFTHEAKLRLAPGRYQLRAAAVDAAARTGSASAWIDLPDLAKPVLALSGLFLARGDEPPRPMAAPRFARAESLELTVVAYNAQRDAQGRSALDATTRLLQAGRELFAQTVDVAVADERVPFSRRLALAALAPGDYELRVAVVDRRNGAAAERAATFTVVE
jgi:VWFA-related protein